MTNDEILMLVAKTMTSGIPQTGATFTLPESMLIELVQRTTALERQACAEQVCEACASAIKARGEK